MCLEEDSDSLLSVGTSLIRPLVRVNLDLPLPTRPFNFARVTMPTSRPSSLARLGLAFAMAALLVPTHGLQQPFQPVETARVVQKRQGSGCIDDFYSCSQYGAAFNGVCCQNGQTCKSCLIPGAPAPVSVPTNSPRRPS